MKGYLQRKARSIMATKSRSGLPSREIGPSSPFTALPNRVRSRFAPFRGQLMPLADGLAHVFPVSGPADIASSLRRWSLFAGVALGLGFAEPTLAQSSATVVNDDYLPCSDPTATVYEATP